MARLPKRECAKKASHQPSRDDRDFMHRRLAPFLSPDVGIYSLEHLMMESYMQGLRDARALLSSEQAA